MNQSFGRSSRRAVLAGMGAGMVALAGCLGSGDGADESPTLGDEDAPVTVEEYTDFACPGCADYTMRHFDDIVTQYVDTGDVQYKHRDLVIPVDDPGSEQAASAAREVLHDAGNEAFWEYKTLLLSQQDELGGGPSFFGELAEEVGADGESVASAAENLEHSSDVEADGTRGRENGVEGTPGFMVEGTVVNGDTLDERVQAVATAIEEELNGN